MSKIIIANWKANPTTLEEALGLFDSYLLEIAKYQNVQLVVCPPFVYLEELTKLLNAQRSTLNAGLGAQDLFWEKSGPYTGEISADMLKNFGVTHALIGHSDRRYKIGLPSTTLGQPKVVLGETDEMINKKIRAALEAGIAPVLLVGERNQNDDRKQILETQLGADLAGLTVEQIAKVLITYEPVWAISTQPDASPSTTFGTKVVLGKPDTPANTLEAIKTITDFLSTSYQLPPNHRLWRATGQAVTSYQFLYGGSVNSNNIADFLKNPEISGAIIGSASLRKEEFAEILKIASNL